MKKIVIVFIFLFLLIPSYALADGIDNYYINSTVLKNGDLEVEEYFELNGNYNGMERIYYAESSKNKKIINGVSYDGDQIEILEVRALNKNRDFNFNNINGLLFEKVLNAKNGDFGVYKETNEINRCKIMIYLPSTKNLAFYVKYKIKNIAILHNDIGELYWNIFDDTFRESINNFIAYVNIPLNINNPKVWGHGPLNGITTVLSNNKVRMTVTNLKAYTAMDIRLAFDKNVLSNTKKQSMQNALERIITYETNLANESNNTRKNIDVENNYNAFLKQPSRINYNLVLYSIVNIADSEMKNNYYEKIVSQQNRVDEWEYNSFSTIVHDDIYYSHYEEAKEKINNVFSNSMKEKMEQELEIFLQKIVKNERQREIKNIIISLLTLTVVLIHYFKPFKLKKRVNPYYFRDIPSNLHPITVELLVNNQITKKSISATIIDLIRQRRISYKKKDKRNYDFDINRHNYHANSNNSLSDSILLLLFGHNREIVNSKEIYKIDNEDYYDLVDESVSFLEKKGLITSLNDFKGKYIIILILGVLIYLITGNSYVNFAFSNILKIVGLSLCFLYFVLRYRANSYIVLFMYVNFTILSQYSHFTFPFSLIIAIICFFWLWELLRRMSNKVYFKLTNQGKEELKKWQGLRNFFIDFSQMKDEELPKIEVWEQYLVYATALGVADKVLKVMQIKIKQNDRINISFASAIENELSCVTDFNDIGRRSSSNMIPIIGLAVVKKVKNTLSQPSRRNKNRDESNYTSFSSGNGNGGGFSGGAGFGGGGSSGGRF